MPPKANIYLWKVTKNQAAKTTWQKIYSFFGFWTYRYNSDRILYWCMFPVGKFYRKFDILRWRID